MPARWCSKSSWSTPELLPPVRRPQQPSPMTLFLIVLLTALVFEYINGFHDAANAIATVVSTKVLTPRQAIWLAVVFNLIGALAGTAVAKTISGGLVESGVVNTITIFSALMGAII